MSVTIQYFWSNLPALRSWIVAALILFVTIEISGIMIRGLTRSYIVPQRQVVAYIRAHSKPGDSIYGTAALLYEMDFDRRLRDDAFLGTQTGRHPDLIIIEDLYRPLYEGWTISRPEAMVEIRKRLSEYKLAKRIAEYEIYLRPERMDDFPSAP